MVKKEILIARSYGSYIASLGYQVFDSIKKGKVGILPGLRFVVPSYPFFVCGVTCFLEIICKGSKIKKSYEDPIVSLTSIMIKSKIPFVLE